MRNLILTITLVASGLVAAHNSAAEESAIEDTRRQASQGIQVEILQNLREDTASTLHCGSCANLKAKRAQCQRVRQCRAAQRAAHAASGSGADTVRFAGSGHPSTRALQRIENRVLRDRDDAYARDGEVAEAEKRSPRSSKHPG